METLEIGNYKKVFKAYEEYAKLVSETNRTSLNTQLTECNGRIAALESKKAELEAWFRKKPAKISATDMRKLEDAEKKNREAITVLEKAKAEHPVLSEADRKDAEERLAEATRVYNETKAKYDELISTGGSEAEINASKVFLDLYGNAVKENQEVIDKDNKNREIVKKAEDNLEKTSNNLKAIREKIAKIDKDAEDYATDYIEKRKELAKVNSDLKKEKEKKANLEAALEANPKDSLESFKKFLEEKGLPTTHAEELYQLYKDPKYSIELGIDDFDLRKQHPKRDFFLKKILAPILVSGGLGGGIAGAVAASGAIAGSNILWAVVSSNPAIGALSAFIPGFLIGAAASAGFIALKNALTIAYYNIRYGNAKAAVKEMKTEKTVETTKIFELLQTINNTKEKILNLRTGAKWTKPFRWIARGFLNIVNRNRIHQIEAVTKGLIVQFEKIYNNKNLSDLTKYEELTPIFELLESIGTSIADDLYNSKIHALLTCKEKGASHSHTIENADIYSNLATYLEIYNDFNEATRVTPTALKTIGKDASKVSLSKKKITAHSLLNNDPTNEETKVGSGLVYKRYKQLADLVKKPVPTPKPVKVILNYGVVGNVLTINYTDGSTSTHVVKNTTNITNVSIDKKNIIITYKGGATVVIKPSSKIDGDAMKEEAMLKELRDNPEFVQYIVDNTGYTKDQIEEFYKIMNEYVNGKSGKATKKVFKGKSAAYKANKDLYETILNMFEAYRADTGYTM